MRMFPGQSRQPRAAFIALGEMIVDAVLLIAGAQAAGEFLQPPSITHPNHTSDTNYNTARKQN